MNGDGEDRISALPDDLIHNIFSSLETKLAVQTSILSKRWVNLWTTLPYLNLCPNKILQPPYFYSRKFVTNFFKNRNHQSVISTFKTDCHKYSDAAGAIVQYAITHNVEHLHVLNANLIFSCVNSSFIKTLHLTQCRTLYTMDWTLPCLTSLYLKDVNFGHRISGFENLKELTLDGYSDYYSSHFSIDSPNLLSLTLAPKSKESTFVISAPNLSYFNFSSPSVPWFFAGDGFPCIKEVAIHIDFFDEDCDDGDWDFDKGKWKQNFITMFNAFRKTPLLRISRETTKVLQMIDISEFQPSPFGNLKILYLQWLHPTMPKDHVINYLLSNSPSAEIITVY